MMHGKTPSPTTPQVQAFRSQMRGEVLEPVSPAYDSTRIIWNGMIDRRPALISRCRTAADVAASVNLPVIMASGSPFVQAVTMLRATRFVTAA